MKKKYNIAFAPLNERLLILSLNISKLLIKKGISVCILKTSLNGSELSAFKNNSLVKKISDIVPIVSVPYLQFRNKVGFFGNILRTIRVHYHLNSKWDAPYDALVTFMDDYSIDEVLTIFSKKKNIPTIMLQEGSEPRRNKYNVSLYDFFSFLRNLIFKNYFHSKAIGLNSDYVAAWSKLNYQHFIKNGRSSKNTFVVGTPYPLEKIKKKNKIEKKILILHQTLYHRYSTVKWNDELWNELSIQLLKKNYNVIFKPHPRADSKKEIALSNYIKNRAKLINKPIKIIKRSIYAEKLIKDADIVITCVSAGANAALGNGIPVIYVDTPFNKNQVLNKLKKKNEIILVKDWRQAINKVNFLFNSKNEMIKWKKKGYSSLIKLAGDPKLFEKSWPKIISDIIKKKNF
tara:strand:- start:3037 stop:4245 length:1209 start_codon:yes stop_codon:yes gene_type:complete